MALRRPNAGWIAPLGATVREAIVAVPPGRHKDNAKRSPPGCRLKESQPPVVVDANLDAAHPAGPGPVTLPPPRRQLRRPHPQGREAGHLQPPYRLPKDHDDTSTSAVEQWRSSCSIIHARTRRLLRRHNA